MSELQPQDWRTLEASEELDVEVAKRLGLKIIHGVIAYWTEDCHRAIDTHWYTETHGIPHLLKKYSTDLNAAFTLFQTELGLEWNLFSDFNGITCELGHWNNEPGRSDQLEQWNDKTAPVAIVKAWLKWQERTDHAAPEFPKGTES